MSDLSMISPLQLQCFKCGAQAAWNNDRMKERMKERKNDRKKERAQREWKRERERESRTTGTFLCKKVLQQAAVKVQRWLSP